MAEDMVYMKRALALAAKGKNQTFPNPRVGAVVVKNDVVIGEGYHTAYGEAHAEEEALRDLGRSAKGATLYVTLEPCSHQGKRPPCVDGILDSGIDRVVFAVNDPNPLVSGKGEEILRSSGVVVEKGVGEEEAEYLNRGFLHFHRTGKIFVAVKFASSLDGKIATFTQDAKWITSEKARQHGRLLRADYQAILVGKHTLLADNPHLGIREKGYVDPLRVFVDTHLSVPLTHQVYRDKNVLVFVSEGILPSRLHELKERGISYVSFRGETCSYAWLLSVLKERGVQSLFVEGGGETIGRFFDEDLVDEVHAYMAPCIIGGTGAKSSVAARGFPYLKDAFWMDMKKPVLLGDTYYFTGRRR